MVCLLPVASGKGGVGKSVIAANLGIALAEGGRTVVLVDLDLGGSNLHTFFGLRNKHPGIGDFVWKRERTIGDLLVETGYERLWLVPGDGLLPATAALDWFAKTRLLKQLALLPADFVILDLGAGSSFNVVDFFLASDEGLLVVKPEITSVLNAYAFLKTTAYRLISRVFPERSPAREELRTFASTKTEGAGTTFLDFARALGERHQKGSEALERLTRFKPRIVMSMCKEGEDGILEAKLQAISAKNLGIHLEVAGRIDADPALEASVAARRPLVAADPGSPFSRGIVELAARI